jgi:ATP-dependent protease ClpP protease subunit
VRKLFLAFVALVAMIAGDIAWGTTLHVDKDRTVSLVGPVGNNAMTAAQEVTALMNASNDPIYMIINSPGGNVITGLQLLSAMQQAQARGIVIKCVVPNLAASMAFITLAQCTERYAFEGSLLLWHPMRVGGSFTEGEARHAANIMRRMSKPLMKLQKEALGVTWQFFMYHYKYETLWSGAALAEAAPSFMTIIDNVEGVDNIFALQ